MQPINVMINGLPGNVSRVIADHIQGDSRFNLLPWSLTGPEIEDPACEVGPLTIKLVKPDNRSLSSASSATLNPIATSISLNTPAIAITTKLRQATTPRAWIPSWMKPPP